MPLPCDRAAGGSVNDSSFRNKNLIGAAIFCVTIPSQSTIHYIASELTADFAAIEGLLIHQFTGGRQVKLSSEWTVFSTPGEEVPCR